MAERTCLMCGASLEGKRRDAACCSKKCAKARWDRDNKATKRRHGREFRNRHRDEINHRVRESRKADPETWRHRDKKYRQSEAGRRYAATYQRNKAVKAAGDRAYRKANRERISVKWNEWAAKNRHRTAAYNQKRSAAKAAAEGHATPGQVAARIAYYGGKCWICRTAPWEHVDHVKPLAQGGSNWPANLRPACKSCNCSKRHTWPYSLPNAA